MPDNLSSNQVVQILFLKMSFYILKLEKTTEFIHLFENIY